MSGYTPSLATAREVFIEGAQGEFLGEDFDRMIARVRARERERCARIAERSAAAQFLAWEIADRIEKEAGQ